MSLKDQFKTFLAERGNQAVTNEIMAAVDATPEDDFVEALDVQIPDYPGDVVDAWNDFRREYAPVGK